MRCLLVIFNLALLAIAALGDVEPVHVALAEDDPCMSQTDGDLDETCALNAIQLRGTKLEGGADERAILESNDDLEAAKPAAAHKVVAVRQDLTEEEFANLTSEVNATQTSIDAMKQRVEDFWKRVNETQTAIDSSMLQEEAKEEALKAEYVTTSSRRRTKGAPALHTKIQKKLAHAQEDVDFLWSSITDLRRANDGSKNYMTSHRRKLTMAQVEEAELQTLHKPKHAATEEEEPEETGGSKGLGEFSGLKDDTTTLGKLTLEVMDLQDELDKVDAEIANVAKTAAKWVAAR